MAEPKEPNVLKMNKLTSDESKTAPDKEFVKQVLADHKEETARFVDRYTDMVLYRVKKWDGRYCPYPTNQCLLTRMYHERKGHRWSGEASSCDNCMDSYLWLFDQLKLKIKGYTGKNGCSLTSFIWNFLHSKEIYIDWKRWKYGRIRVPKSLDGMTEEEQKVLMLLRFNRDEYSIARELDVSPEQAKELIHDVKTRLIKEGKIHLIDRPVTFSLDQVGADDEESKPYEIPDTAASTETQLMAGFYRKLLDESIRAMPSDHRRVLRTYYRYGNTAGEILDEIVQGQMPNFLEKEADDLVEDDVYRMVNLAVTEMMDVFNRKLEKQGVRLSLSQMKEVLKLTQARYLEEYSTVEQLMNSKRTA